MYEGALPPTLSGPAIVVEPVLETAKSVEVEKLAAVVDEMLNTNPYAGVPVAEVTSDKRPNGEVVPTPIEPARVMVVVPVAPNAPVDAASVRLNMLVPVALKKLKLPARLNVPPSVVLPPTLSALEMVVEPVLETAKSVEVEKLAAVVDEILKT
jgi:hypothetical protein